MHLTPVSLVAQTGRNSLVHTADLGSLHSVIFDGISTGLLAMRLDGKVEVAVLDSQPVAMSNITERTSLLLILVFTITPLNLETQLTTAK